MAEFDLDALKDSLLRREVSVGREPPTAVPREHLETMAAAGVFAYLRPEHGVLLILAFDLVLAGCFVPLALGFFWKRTNAPGAVAAIVAGAMARLTLFFALPEGYGGLDTLVAPVVSLVVCVVVSLATQGRSKPKQDALEYAPTNEELVSGAY